MTVFLFHYQSILWRMWIILFYPKQEPKICTEVEALSGSLKPYIGTDNEVIDEEKTFLQALLDDDNRIKAGQ